MKYTLRGSGSMSGLRLVWAQLAGSSSDACCACQATLRTWSIMTYAQAPHMPCSRSGRARYFSPDVGVGVGHRQWGLHGRMGAWVHGRMGAWPCGHVVLG